MLSLNNYPESNIHPQQVIDLILTNWDNRVQAFTDYFSQHDDAFYLQQVASGKNRALYILGHTLASNNGLNVLLRFGERDYPDYQQLFHSSPDGEHLNLPAVSEVKQAWIRVNEKLMASFRQLSPKQWFEKHTSVSEEDFKKELNRNKLNVLISRLTHLGYHIGQLKLLKSKL